MTAPLLNRFIQPLKRIYYWLDDLYCRYVYERPNARFRNALVRSVDSPNFRNDAQTLCREGFVVIRDFFDPKTVAQMKKDFHELGKEQSLDPHGRLLLFEANGVTVRDSFIFSQAAAHPYLTALASYYWGKPVYLAQSAGYRYEPRAPETYGPFQWHHDTVHKQVKVMILLDDVPDDGQRMDYLPRTHTIWYRFPRGKMGYGDTRFSDQEATRHGTPVPCSGRAGTIILFDTNGLHRANNSLTSPSREAWVFSYTAGRNLHPLAGLHPEVVKQLEAASNQISWSERPTV